MPHRHAYWITLGLAAVAIVTAAITAALLLTAVPQPTTPPPSPVAEKPGLIRVTSLTRNQAVTSPLLVTGQARGYWFFEASFPVRLYDDTGQELALAIATAETEWMTEDYVPFHATLRFTPPPSDTGWLVLEKDNPSGLPEHADQLVVPIRFP